MKPQDEQERFMEKRSLQEMKEINGLARVLSAEVATFMARVESGVVGLDTLQGDED